MTRIATAAAPVGELEVAEVVPVEGNSALAIIPNVPLVTVGEWAASTGPFDATLERCMDAVAAQDDPGIIRPRVWAGHRPDELRQGEPALGIIASMRFDPDTLTVYGDVLTLASIAAAAPVLFPNRSVEAWTPFRSTATGREFAMVIDGLALLGVEWPAVPVLEDLTRLASGDLGALIVDGNAGRIAAAANLEAGARRVVAAGSWTTEGKDGDMPIRHAAQVEMDLVWREFYAQHEDEHPWWWIRADLVDPLALVIDMGEQGLATMEVTVSGDTVTFGDPVPVAVQYVPKGSDASAQVAAALGRVSRVSATHDTADATRHRSTTGDTMDVNALRVALGDKLPPDATDEDVVAFAASELAAGANPGDGEGGGDGGEGEGGEPSSEEAPAPTAVAAGAGAPVVAVDAARLAALEADAAAGREARERIAASDRDAVLDDAIRTGRIVRASRDEWDAALKRDHDGTAKLLASLTPGKAAPVGGEVGHGNDPGAQGGDGLTHEQIMAMAWGKGSAGAATTKGA